MNKIGSFLILFCLSNVCKLLEEYFLQHFGLLLFSMVFVSFEDVWEVLQSQFEKSQDFNLPLNGNNQLQQDGTQIQYYQNGNGKQQYSPYEGNGGNNGNFITNGGSIGNGNNGSSSSNKTVMDINGRKNNCFKQIVDSR